MGKGSGGCEGRPALQTGPIEQTKAAFVHDSNGAIGLLRGNITLAKRKIDRAEDLETERDYLLEKLEAMEQNVVRLVSLIKQFDAQDEPLTQYDLGAQLRSVATEYSDTATITVHADAVSVNARMEALQRVFSQLVENAIRWTQDEHDGAIKLAVSEDEAGHWVTVTDNGPGVAPEDYDRIFEQGYTTHAEGTGIGLAVCRELVEREGMTINIVPSTVGAEFRIGPFA